MLPHIIGMEHSYCKKKSIVVVKPFENNGSVYVKEGDCVMKYDLMEVVDEVDGIQGGCVLENDMIEEVKEVKDDDHEQESVLENVMTIVVEEVDKGDYVQENSCVLEDVVMKCAVEGNRGDYAIGDACASENILKNNIQLNENDFIGTVNYSPKSVIKNSNNSNNETVDQVRENSKPKSSRKYDPAIRKMRYLKSRNKVLKHKLRESQLKSPKVNNKKSKVKKDIDEVLKILSTAVPPEQYNFIKLQITNAGRRKKGYRFTFDEKTLALVIYKQNPKRYGFIANRAKLPTRQTLIKHAAAIRFMEGINPKLMNFIKEEVSQLDEMDKVCTIGWDEMSLTAHLDFDQVKDYIDGFEDLSNKRTNNFATHALVFMIRGMKSAYKQPIAYFLTENIDSAELAELVRLVIGAVLDVGELFNLYL